LENTTNYCVRDILTRPTWHRTALRNFLNSEDILMPSIIRDNLKPGTS